MSTISIPEKTVTQTLIQTKTFNAFEIENMTIEIGLRVNVRVKLLFIENGLPRPVDYITVVVEGEAYNNWSEANLITYITDYLANL